MCANNRIECVAESCDTGGVETASCTASCSRPMCGDGHVNGAGEECDDGRLNNDAGHCTTACKLHLHG